MKNKLIFHLKTLAISRSYVTALPFTSLWSHFCLVSCIALLGDWTATFMLAVSSNE